MLNNYEQNIASLTQKLRNVTNLLEQKVLYRYCLSFSSCQSTSLDLL